MLLFYVCRLRFIWSSFPVRWVLVQDRALQVWRLVIDFDGGHGIVIRQWRLL